MGMRLGQGFVEFFLKDGRFMRGLSKIRAGLQATQAAMRTAAAWARNMLLVAGAAAAATIKLHITQAAAEKKLEAVLRATGNAAGFTAKQLKEQAKALQELTAVGDEAIINAQAVMATFVQIRGDVFEDAISAALDMSAVLKQDLQGSVVQLGKALNDPITGLTALRRVGISFTDAQKKQIEELVKAGRLYEAQRIILDELKNEFGGTAQAMEEATGGLGALKQAVGDVAEKIGGELLRRIGGLTEGLRSLAAYMNKMSRQEIRELTDRLVTLGKVLATIWIAPKIIGGMMAITGAIRGLIVGMKALAVGAGTASTAIGVGLVGALAAAVVGFGLLIASAIKSKAAMMALELESLSFARAQEKLKKARQALREAKTDDERIRALQTLIPLTERQAELEEDAAASLKQGFWESDDQFKAKENAYKRAAEGYRRMLVEYEAMLKGLEKPPVEPEAPGPDPELVKQWEAIQEKIRQDAMEEKNRRIRQAELEADKMREIAEQLGKDQRDIDKWLADEKRKILKGYIDEAESDQERLAEQQEQLERQMRVEPEREMQTQFLGLQEFARMLSTTQKPDDAALRMQADQLKEQKKATEKHTKTVAELEKVNSNLGTLKDELKNVGTVGE